MNRYLLLALALLAAPIVSADSPAPAPKALPFPHEGSDLKPDPVALFGTLPNGLRYVVRPNAEPKDRVSLRLLVLAGSLHEEDDQRGLAHFLEHMAFNGSKNYPPGTLVKFFQRMGMNFGGDTNASTSFERTIYQLELAHADRDTIAEGLRVLSDYAGGLFLSKEEIERERGVILSEKRVGDSVAYRTFLAQFSAMLGSTRLPKRVPIGDAEVIAKADRARFLDFWNTWYRPERMVVVAVGNFPENAAVEKLITSEFAALTARAPARPEPLMGELANFEGFRAAYHPEPEAPATNISLSSYTPYSRQPDNKQRQIERLPRLLALSMLNRRFSILAKKEGAPFVSASASVAERFNFLREADLDISSKPENWQAALAVGEQELRRALEHGFTDAELKESAANLLNQLELAVQTAPTRHSNRIADELASNVLEGDVSTTAEADLALLKPALEKITPEMCAGALRDAYADKGRYVMVTGNAQIPSDPAAAITAAYERANAVAVEPLTPDEVAAWAYTDFGPPGEVVRREHVEDLDLHLITFKNGVRLNLKKTNFEAGRIRLSARVGSGGITEPREQSGLAALTSATFNSGGLGQHSADDLRQILAGRNISAQFQVAPDAFTFSGVTTPDDLVLQFQFLTAALTDPGYRPEALRQAQKGIEQLYLSFKHTANGPLATEIANLLASGDQRFGLPSREEMLARNLEEVQAWLAPHFAQGALEVALVGDLDLEATIAAATRTIGALPPREPKPALEPLKKVAFPAKPFAQKFPIESEIPKGTLLLYWPTDDGIDVRRNRRFSLLTAILNDRMREKVREEVGGTYSPRAASNASDVFPGYGYITASIDVEPAAADKMAGLVIGLADDLAKKGVTPDELKRARLPLLTAMRESLRDNGYWLGAVLDNAQERPEVLDWARTRQEDIEGITAEELSALAKKYLGRAQVSRATILPGAAAPASVGLSSP